LFKFSLIALAFVDEDKEMESNMKLGGSTVAIGNPERHVHKASHCGSKQQ